MGPLLLDEMFRVMDDRVNKEPEPAPVDKPSMPDVTKTDMIAVATALIAFLSVFGLELSMEQTAAATALAIAVIGVLPWQDRKRRESRNSRAESEAMSGAFTVEFEEVEE